MAASSAAMADASAMATGEEPTTVEMASVEEPTPMEEPVTIDEEASEEPVKVQKPKKATSKRMGEQPEMQQLCHRPLQRQGVIQAEQRRAARLIRRHMNSFAIYFPKVLRNVHVGFTLSQRSVRILDSFVMDMFERIATEASNLARHARRRMISSRDIQTVVRLLLPGELCKRATAEGTLALFRYISKR